MDINIPNKNTGEYLSATEFNQVVTGVNSKADKSALQFEIDARIAEDTEIQNQIDTKLESTDFKTINGFSIIGSGNIIVSGGTSVDSYTRQQSDSKYQLIGNYLTGVDYSIISNKPIIPVLISQLTNDSAFITATGLTNYYTKTQSDTKYLTTVDYSIITNKPIIPTGTSQLTNNSNFISSASLSGYTTSTGLTTALSTKADLVGGVIPLAQMPEANLSPLQFETLPDGTIGIRTSYLQSLGLVGTGTTTPTLSTPTGFNVSGMTTSALTVSWNAVANATSYQLERANNVDYTGATVVYSGSLTSFNNTGLTASINYFYRVKAKANSYTDSAYATATGATSAVIIPTGSTTGSTANVITGFSLLDLSALTSGEAFTKLGEKYTVTSGNGTAHLQPMRKMSTVGSAIAFKFIAGQTKKIQVYTKFGPNNLDGGVNSTQRVDYLGTCFANFRDATQNLQYPVQPINGQYIVLEKGIDLGSNITQMFVKIIGTDGSTVVDTREYAIDTIADGVVQIDITDEGSIEYFQGKNLSIVS